MTRGFVYLFAILDWASRRVLAWRLSNTLTTDFCLEAVQDALAHYGTPECNGLSSSGPRVCAWRGW